MSDLLLNIIHVLWNPYAMQDGRLAESVHKRYIEYVQNNVIFLNAFSMLLLVIIFNFHKFPQ